MNILKLYKKSIAIVLVTLIFTGTIVYFDVYKLKGYKVSVGGSTVAFVRSKKEFNKAYEEFETEVKAKYKNPEIKSNFTLVKAKADDETRFISGINLKQVILKNSNIKVDALIMKADNKKITYVINQNQGKELLTLVKNHYSSLIKTKDISKVQIENKITYEPIKVKLSDLYKNEEILRELIKYNNAQIPLITVKIVANFSRQEKVSPTTIVKASDNLMSGVKKTQCEGVEGIRKVTTQVIAYNNRIVSQKKIKEDNIKLVQNKIILIGTNKPVIVQLTSINTPSRGSISSNFGMRWGKMHKGIDIAANFGANINAVLKGTVIYAGWQDGYGKVIKINHGEGIETTYAHCSSIKVEKGQEVNRGEKIGEVGSTGNSTGPHLHFEVRENGEPKNPEKYIK